MRPEGMPPTPSSTRPGDEGPPWPPRSWAVEGTKDQRHGHRNFCFEETEQQQGRRKQEPARLPDPCSRQCRQQGERQPPTREAIEGCPVGAPNGHVALADLFLQGLRRPLPCQSPHPRRACWRASTTKSARVPTNSSQTSSCTHVQRLHHVRQLGAKVHPVLHRQAIPCDLREDKQAHGHRARSKEPPRVVRVFPRHRRTHAAPTNSTPHKYTNAAPTNNPHNTKRTFNRFRAANSVMNARDSNATFGAPKATAIGTSWWPNHATTLCTGRSPAIPQHGCGAQAPRDPSRSAGNIPCGAPSTTPSSTSLESTATRGSPASHRQMTPQGQPGPGPTTSRHQTNAISCSQRKPRPPSQAVDQWGSTTGRVPRQHRQEGDAQDGFSDWFQGFGMKAS